MADINLLQNSGNNKKPLTSVSASLAVKIAGLILILVLAYYAYLWFAHSRANKDLSAWTLKTSQAQSQAINEPGRQELITRQGQIKELDSLITHHVSWSYLLPELARVTLGSTTYANVSAKSDGTLQVTVNAPSYAELDKYLQVFNLPQFNQQFSDVKVLSITKAQEGSNLQTQMKLELLFNPQFIKRNTNDK